MSGNRTLSPELLRQLKPYVLGWVTGRISGGSTPSGSVEHNSLTLSSYLDDILSVDTYQVLDLATEIANTVLAGPTSGAAARPTFRALVNADLPSAIVSNSHARSHSITGASDHTVTGSANQIVGLTGTNVLGILSPLSTVGAGTIPIGGTAGAITWSGTQTFSTAATFSQGLAITGAYSVTLGGDVAISRTAANVLGLASGDSMQSSTYTSGAAGWKIGADGSAEFQNIKARGEFHASVFVQDMVEAHAGTLMVSKSAATLYSAMTVPANVASERVTNGTFDSVTTGWTAGASAALSIVAGGQDGNCLKIVNGAANYGYALQSITTVIGQSYTIGLWYKNGTGQGLLRVGTSYGGNELVSLYFDEAAWAWKTATFVATTTTTYIRVGHSSTSLGADLYYDGITCTCWSMTLNDPPATGFLLDNGDICRCKAQYSGGIGDIWFKVGNRRDNGDGTQTYSCTYLSGTVTSEIIYPAGAAILDYGTTTAGGMVALSADGAIGSGANLSILTHAGAPYTTTTVKARLGNLNGSYGQVADVYGFGVGDYSGGNYLLYDGTTFTINAGGGNVVIDGDGLRFVTYTAQQASSSVLWKNGTYSPAYIYCAANADGSMSYPVSGTGDKHVSTGIISQSGTSKYCDLYLRCLVASEYTTLTFTKDSITCDVDGTTRTAVSATGLAITGELTSSSKFGCNGATAQAKYALDAAVSGTVDDTYGADEHAVLDKLVSQINKIRSALVANGICS